MRILTVGCLVVVLSAPLRATMLVGADLGELSHDAIAIARGAVVAINGRWADGHRTIETIVTLKVERYLKGSLGDTVEFRVPGGEFGRFRNIVVGAPAFTLDERVVVFLGARGPSIPYVLGLSQGVFRVGWTHDGWAITSPAFFPSSSAPARIVRGDAQRWSVDLAEFEQRIINLTWGSAPHPGSVAREAPQPRSAPSRARNARLLGGAR
jgi:hypothetical protein